MLAEATGSREPLALEHRNRAVGQEHAGDLPAGGVFRIALHRASPEPRDLAQGAFEGDGGDPAAPVLPVDEEARDPPVRQGVDTFQVGAPVLDARQLVGGPELAPAHAGRAVVHEGGVGPALPDATLLLGSVLPRSRASDTFGMKGHAPAAAA